jgi:hypothetical protein
MAGLERNVARRKMVPEVSDQSWKTILSDDLSVLVFMELLDHRAVESGQCANRARNGRLNFGHTGGLADRL